MNSNSIRLRAKAGAFIAACLAGTALTAPAQAQTPGGQLPEVTVTSPTTVPTPLSQVASSITVITAADMERDQRRNVTDALQAVPGLNIVQNGGPGSLTSIFMRGTNANHTKIMIDGIDVSDPSNPDNVFDLGTLTSADIERIEVLRGPQSGLYGSDAIGGVISITTKKGSGPAKITALLEGGSRGTVNAAAGVSGSQDRFNYALNVSAYRTTTPVTPLNLLAPGVPRFDDRYVNKTVSGKFGYDLSEYITLNWTGRYTRADLAYTGDNFFAFPSVPADQQANQTAKQFYQRSEAVVSLFDGRMKNYFGVNYGIQDRVNTDFYGGSGPLTTYQGERTKYDWRSVSTFIPGQTVVVGAEREKEKYKNGVFSVDPNTFAFIDPFIYNRAQNGNTGVYAELQSNFSDRVFVTSNIRNDDNDAFGQHSTYRIAPAVIVPVLETKLKGSYATGFKAPTLAQLYDPTFGNAALRPEESKGYDVGFEQPITNRFRFGTTYFNNDIINLIRNTTTFPFAYANVRNAKTDGFESFAAFNFNDRFSIRADHTLTHVEAYDGTVYKQLTRRPEHKTSVAVIIKPIEDLTLSATLVVVGQYADVGRFGGPIFTAPGYKVLNIAANYIVAPGVTAFARVDNAFDEKYQQATGFLNPGLGVFGGVRFASAPFAN